MGELEFEKEFEVDGNELEPENEMEFKLEWNYGWACKINEHWNAGLELKNENVFKKGELELSILSAGPGVSYSTCGFWINLGLMPQIANLKGGGRELIEHDGLQARLIFSYEF